MIGSLTRWLCRLLLLAALPAFARNYRFDGSMSEEVLRSYLSRSMTTMYLLTGHGDFDDNLRMLTNCGVKFAGRQTLVRREPIERGNTQWFRSGANDSRNLDGRHQQCSIESLSPPRLKGGHAFGRTVNRLSLAACLVRANE